MSLFGMGAGEIMVIMIIALIIFGPGRLPEIMSQIGRTVREFKKMTSDLTSEFEGSVGDVRSTVGEVRQTMDDMKATVADVQRETTAIANTIPATLEEANPQKLLNNPMSPPASATPSPKPAASAAAATDAAAASVAPTNGVQPQPERDGASEPVATRDDPLADLSAFEEALEGELETTERKTG
jgi:TatA/E family protein of Tat protein translocase